MLGGAIFIVIANIVVDIAYAYLDPRVMRLSSQQPAVTPLLEVEDLRVEFPTDDGVVHAVDGISYTRRRRADARHRRRVGLGQDRLLADDARADPQRRAPTIEGRIMFEGRDLLTHVRRASCARIRGNEIAMIFQDPLSSLHPFFKVGAQLVEAMRVHRDDLQAAGARARASSCSSWSASPTPTRASTSTRTSSPAACASAR